MDLWRWRPQEVKRKSVRRQRRPVAKTVLRLPDLEVAKSAVLNSLSCPDARRGYRHAIDEFVDWYCSEPRLSFSKTVVVRYRMHKRGSFSGTGLFVLDPCSSRAYPATSSSRRIL